MTGAKKGELVRKDRKSASAGVQQFTCNVETTSAEKSIENSIILNGQADFAGTETHQRITLFAKEGRQGLIVNDFFKDPSQPYIIDSVSCTTEMMCVGSRTKYQKGVPRKQNLEIRKSYAGVDVGLGEEVVFQYTSLSNGFRIQSVQSGSSYKDKPFGIIVVCNLN